MKIITFIMRSKTDSYLPTHFKQNVSFQIFVHILFHSNSKYLPATSKKII